MKSNDLSNLLIGQERKSRNGSNGAEPPDKLMPKSASLLDDTLSDKKKKTNWKTPIWIALLVIAAGVFAMYLAGPDEAGRAEAARKAEASRNPALLEKLVNEAKVAETGENGLQAEPLRQNNTGAPAAATTINKTPAKITSSPQPPPAVQKPAPAPAAQTPARTQDVSAEQELPENMPQLIRDVKKEAPPAEVMAPAQETAPQIDSGQKSFDYLEKNSAVAAKLINGGFSNLSYLNWKVIRETSQEVWIDIEAAWTSGGPAIHHIWSVDTKNEKIRALSQAARNLEALSN